MGEAIYFVSDTHLGDGSGADRFQFQKVFLNLLQRIEEEPQVHLVLLGDFMELWASSLEPILIHYAPVLGLIGRIATKHRVTYVVGNHDCLPWYYFVNQGTGNIRVVDQFQIARGALVALHGHQFDPFNQVKVSDDHVKVPWTRKLVQVMGFLGRVGGEATGDALADAGNAIEAAVGSLETLLPQWEESTRQSFGGFLRHTKNIVNKESPGERGYPPGEAMYEEGARRLMRSGAKIVVMGHTHHPLVHRYGDRTYVNTGSWVSEQYPPTYARYAEGRIELLEADGHRPFLG